MAAGTYFAPLSRSNLDSSMCRGACRDGAGRTFLLVFKLLLSASKQLCQVFGTRSRDRCVANPIAAAAVTDRLNRRGSSAERAR